MRASDRTSELRHALGKCRAGFTTVAAFSAFINILMLVSPIYMMQVYDRVLTSRSVETLIVLSGLAVGLLVVMGAFEALRAHLMVRISGRMEALLGGRVLDALFRASVTSPARGTTHSVQDFDQLRQFLTGNGLIALFDVPWLPVFLAFVFLLHPVLGFIATGGAVFLFALALLNEIVTRRPLRDAAGQAIATSGFISSALRNAEVVHGMGMFGNLKRRWAGMRDETLTLQARASDRAGVIKGMSKSARLLLQIAILGAGAYLAIHDQISAGAIIAASILMGRALAPVETAIGSWPQLIATQGAYRRLATLLEEVPEPEPRTSLPRPQGRLCVESVTAMPPGGQRPTLKRIDFEVPPGNVLGVVGPSGAGKSTLARLLVGAWPPYVGCVRLDGADVSTWPREEFGAHVGYLPQDIELFEGTVSENIARCGEVDSDKVVEAAERAHAHDMILRLSNGYDTPIGAGGAVLSAGQRQRVAFARALYGNPVLVVLDEPNSNLDATGEGALLDAVKDLREEGRTVVLITHRPSILGVTDRLLVLTDGTVSRFGPSEEILAQIRRPPEVAPRNHGAQLKRASA